MRWTYNQTLAERVAVPCAPLSGLFALLRLARIDVMVVDVEGSEDELLQTIDWRATHVGLLSVELTKLNKTRNRAVLTRNFEVLNKGRGGKQVSRSLMKTARRGVDRARRR